jgi:hypothetical protein
LGHEELGSARADGAAPRLPVQRASALNAGRSSEHAHDHCSALAPLQAQGLALADPASVSLPALSGEESAASVQRHAYRAIALLDYAPKLPPPSVFG